MVSHLDIVVVIALTSEEEIVVFDCKAIEAGKR